MTTRQRSAARSPRAIDDAWQKRTLLVKQEAAAVSDANDAKTARLKDLRLEKEKLEAVAVSHASDKPKRAARR